LTFGTLLSSQGAGAHRIGVSRPVFGATLQTYPCAPERSNPLDRARSGWCPAAHESRRQQRTAAAPGVVGPPETVRLRISAAERPFLSARCAEH